MRDDATKDEALKIRKVRTKISASRGQAAQI